MAVYTHISEENIRRHLAQFDIGDLLSYEGIAEGVENTNYKLTTTQGRFILTLFEKRALAADLPFCLSFMEHLRRQSIPCPQPVKNRNGEKTPLLGGRASVIMTFLEGAWPRRIDTQHAAAAGRLLARMHAGSAGFAPQSENSMSLPAWKKLIGSCGKETDTLASGLAHLLQRELHDLEEYWPEGVAQGAVHADLFPDNVFFTDHKVSGVIDFYFSCTDAFAYDLMLTLNAWCFTPAGVAEPEKISAFLGAYQKERTLTDEERAALPFFGRAAAVRILATRLYDALHPAAGAVVTPKNPLPYVNILKFYQSGGFPA